MTNINELLRSLGSHKGLVNMAIKQGCQSQHYEYGNKRREQDNQVRCDLRGV